MRAGYHRAGRPLPAPRSGAKFGPSHSDRSGFLTSHLRRGEGTHSGEAPGMSELEKIARAMVAPHKGILAADESSPTIKKRFDQIKVESTEDNRRAYREILFTAPGAHEFISGVILYDETIRQKASDGTPFPKLLERRGILPGIKVDKGTKALAAAPDEKITEGLDGLRERLGGGRGGGARLPP